MFSEAVDYGQNSGNYSRRKPGVYKDGKGGYVKVNADKSVSPYKPSQAERIRLGFEPAPKKRDPSKLTPRLAKPTSREEAWDVPGVDQTDPYNIKVSTVETPAADSDSEPVSESRGQGSDAAPDGSGSKGTNTGFKGFEVTVDGVGKMGNGGQIADINSFLSEQLPVSPGESEVELGETGFGAKPQPGTGAFNGETVTNWNSQLPSFSEERTSDDLPVYEGASIAGNKDGDFTVAYSDAGRADQKRDVNMGFADAVDERFAEGAEYGETYATNYDPRRTAQRNAFLADNGGDSVRAVIESNKAIGVYRDASGAYANDGGTMRKISDEAYNQHTRTGLSAGELKDAYVGEIKQTLVPADTPDVSNPDAAKGDEWETDTDIDTGAEYSGVGSAFTQEDPQVIEFEMNNNMPSFSEGNMEMNYWDKD